MADLSKEWCEVRIEYYEYEAANGLPVTREHYAKHAQALRIAARVLDEGFGAILQAHIEAAMDSAIPEPWDVSRHHTQAVINYLLEGKE